MTDQFAIKEKFKKNQMDKTKLVSHFEGGEEGEERKEERKKRKKKEEKRKRYGFCMDFYGFLWISLDTCIYFYGFV